MFVMPIMMINILIAMMGNTYTTVIAQAEKAWRQQYAQIVMVLERSVRKERLAACQLEYSIKLNENGDNMDTRGLMVIKQTKKTRARQRKQAITNWKVRTRKLHCDDSTAIKRIARTVISSVQRLGPEHTKQLLHSHDRLFDDAQAAIVNRPNRSSSSLFPHKFLTEHALHHHFHPPPPPPPPPQNATETERVESKTESLQISAPVSLQSEQDAWRPGSGETDLVESHDVVNIGRDHTVSGFLSQTGAGQSWSFGAATFAVGRGSIHGPAIEIPSIPARAATVASTTSTINNSTPPPRAISPKIRTDMFRRKGSPATNTSSSNSSRSYFSKLPKNFFAPARSFLNVWSALREADTAITQTAPTHFQEFKS
ncbi:hypothetical protein L596_004295 [Steinernema carpocapsae]|nr:hypothetical protein L596_004295 [Steinernema carpocapsae]